MTKTLEIPKSLHHQPSDQAQQFFGGSNFLVVKLTDYCNLACTYCHQDALTGKPVLMPMETFKNAVRLILGSSNAEIVYVQFHGGEPLLQPDEFFEEAVAFCKEELESEKRRVEFFIQTNLVKVDAAKRKLLKDLKIGISFSMDGSPEINDLMRGGSRRIQENWRGLKKENSDAGTICLIQPTNWDRMDEVIDYFEKEGIFNARFNLMVPDGRGKDVYDGTADKLFEAKRQLLDYMLETKGHKVTDVTLHSAMKKFVKTNGAPSSFEYAGCEALYCQAGRSLFSINPDGSFYTCDRIAEYPHWSMGNVNHEFGDREKTLAAKKRKEFHFKDDWWARCEGCDAKKICEFSCSAYYVDKVDTREVECEYTRKMYAYMMNKKEEIKAFMSEGRQTLFIDEKTPLQDQREENWEIKDIAADAAFNNLSLNETLAMNKYYQLVKRGEQYFIYVYKRDKIFEVDEMVAEIAKFNGCVPPDYIQQALSDKMEPGKLGKTLDSIQQAIPEILIPNAVTKNMAKGNVVMA